MFVVFADTWQSYVHTYRSKFLSYLPVGFTKFLNGIISSISKVKHFCGNNLPTEEF